jgi:hypothetical protein
MNHGIMPHNLSHTNIELLPLAVAATVLIFFFCAKFYSFIQHFRHAVPVNI